MNKTKKSTPKEKPYGVEVTRHTTTEMLVWTHNYLLTDIVYKTCFYILDIVIAEVIIATATSVIIEILSLPPIWSWVQFLFMGLVGIGGGLLMARVAKAEVDRGRMKLVTVKDSKAKEKVKETKANEKE